MSDVCTKKKSTSINQALLQAHGSVSHVEGAKESLAILSTQSGLARGLVQRSEDMVSTQNMCFFFFA